MKVAISIGGPTAVAGDEWLETERYVVESERLGVDLCWSSEGWGQDAIVPLAYLAARTSRIRLGTGIMQVTARVPSMAAMTAMTLASLSHDRFVLGLGVSGPQVVEGLHGVSFRRPLARLREYMDILDMAFAGERLHYSGEAYTLPWPDGQGKQLRLAQVPARPIPVYLATLAPKGLELTGARADGWLGTCFVPEAADVFFDPIRRGAQGAGRNFDDIDLQAGGPVLFGENIDVLLTSVRKAIAFQIGAMGSREQNFYKAAYQRAGFEAEAETVQHLWLDGQRDAAIAAVSVEMARLSSFAGTDAMVLERLRAFRDAGVTTICAEPVGNTTKERIETLARFIDLIRDLEPQHSLDRSSGGDMHV
jgi:F420-dependent oxidoreductase-like protein